MGKKTPVKYNEACIKIFEFISMLYDGDVEFTKVIEHFSDGKYDGTSNTHVTLNKYLNTLKIFGIKVKKIKSKYKMFSSPYKLPLEMDDIKSIKLLKNAAEYLPDGKCKNDFQSFIHALELRFDENAFNVLQMLDMNPELSPDFANKKFDEQIKKCEKYCLDKQKLEISYINPNGEVVNVLCIPLEQVYEKRRVWLKAMGNNGHRVYEIPIDSIISVHQLPVISQKQYPHSATIVYRIKGRLAKNYKIRTTERIDRLEADGSKIVVNKDEDLDILLRRLMRYGTQCEIVSPKFFREEMVELINKTLSNYK